MGVQPARLEDAPWAKRRRRAGRIPPLRRAFRPQFISWTRCDYPPTIRYSGSSCGHGTRLCGQLAIPPGDHAGQFVQQRGAVTPRGAPVLTGEHGRTEFRQTLQSCRSTGCVREKRSILSARVGQRLADEFRGGGVFLLGIGEEHAFRDHQRSPAELRLRVETRALVKQVLNQ